LTFDEFVKLDLQGMLDANFNSGSNITDFVKLTKEGSNITVQVDTNGTAGGAENADWVDVAILDNSASSADQLTILIDDTDHQFTV